MVFDCSSGSSFILSGHLCIVIAEPSGIGDDVVVLYLTSRKLHSDTTVILTPKDHPFIKHETVISYADARIMTRESVMRRVAERDFQPHEPFRNDVYRVILKGLLDSPRTPRDTKAKFL